MEALRQISPIPPPVCPCNIQEVEWNPLTTEMSRAAAYTDFSPSGVSDAAAAI